MCVLFQPCQLQPPPVLRLQLAAPLVPASSIPQRTTLPGRRALFLQVNTNTAHKAIKASVPTFRSSVHENKGVKTFPAVPERRLVS